MVVRDHQLEPAQGHGRAHPRRPVSEALSVVRENGRDIPVVNEPAPGGDRAPVTASVGTAPAQEQAASNGRSL